MIEINFIDNIERIKNEYFNFYEKEFPEMRRHNFFITQKTKLISFTKYG